MSNSDELEALRLADVEGIYHEQAADQMGISRRAFGRIIESARRKVAQALIQGMALRIEGGVIEMAEQRTFRCVDCEHEWQLPFGTGRPTECLQCHVAPPGPCDGGPQPTSIPRYDVFQGRRQYRRSSRDGAAANEGCTPGWLRQPLTLAPVEFGNDFCGSGERRGDLIKPGARNGDGAVLRWGTGDCVQLYSVGFDEVDTAADLGYSSF